MVAQGNDLPIHLGSMPDAVRAIVSVFGSDVHEGDVFIHNDPYFGGSHLPDVNVIRPAFLDGLLLGYTCLRAHWPDVGSATPGSYGAVSEIYGEGLRLPPLRLVLPGCHECRPREADPGERPHARRAAGRSRRAVGRHASRRSTTAGTGTTLRPARDRRDHGGGHGLLRAPDARVALVDLPDGEGTFEDFCDGDGIADNADGSDARFRVRMHIKKSGDRLLVDFAGSDPQVKGPMNAPLSVTASGVYCGLKMAVDPGSSIPPNSGCWRAISIEAPEASVVNAAFPAPVVYANHEMSHRVADMVMGALAAIWPDRVMACSQGTSAVVTFGGVDPRSGTRYVSYETIKGVALARGRTRTASTRSPAASRTP